MDPASEMRPALTAALTWLPFIVYVVVLYFFFLRPLQLYRRRSSAWQT